MKTCPLCGTTYATRVEFCFRDGTPLTDGAARPAVALAPAESADPDVLAPPSPLDPPAPVLRPPPSPGREVPLPKGSPGGISWKDKRASLNAGDTLVPSEEDEEPAVSESAGPEGRVDPRSAEEPSGAVAPRVAPAGKPGGTNWLIILAALAILGIGGAWLFAQSTRGGPPPEKVAVAPAVEPPPSPPPVEPPPAPPEPEVPPEEAVEQPPTPVAPTPSTLGTPTPATPEGQRPAGTEGRPAPTGAEDPTARSKAPTEKRDATAPSEGGTGSQWSGGTTAEAPAASTGKLTITSSPAGATVRLNGKAQPGVTPLDLSLPYGAYEVELELAGHKVRSRKVDLASAAVSVPIELQALVVEGTVMIFGPVGAKAFVDEKEVLGNLPGKMTLSEGKHTFRLVTADGVSSEEVHTVRFDPSGAQFSVTLQRK